MATLFVRHEVADYDAWKRGYDSFEQVQKDNGVLEESVYHDADDASIVIVTHKFRDIDAARRFVSLESLKEAMRELGVKGTPTFWFGEEAD